MADKCNEDYLPDEPIDWPALNHGIDDVGVTDDSSPVSLTYPLDDYFELFLRRWCFMG